MSCLRTLLHHALIMTSRTSESRRNAKASSLYLLAPDGLGAQWLWGNREALLAVKNAFGNECWENCESWRVFNYGMFPLFLRGPSQQRSTCSMWPEWSGTNDKADNPDRGLYSLSGEGGGKEFPALERLVFDSSLLSTSERTLDLTESPNLDPGYTVWCAHLSNKTTRIPTKCSCYSTERMWWVLPLKSSAGIFIKRGIAWQRDALLLVLHLPPDASAVVFNSPSPSMLHLPSRLFSAPLCGL